MAETNLPEGTDKIIEGAGIGGTGGGTGRSNTSTPISGGSTAGNSTGARTSTTASSDATSALITTGDSGMTDNSRSGTNAGGGGPGGDGKGGVRGMISNASTKARDEAANRARGLVSQGLERSSTALTNVATLIEDTVEQIGEKLGPQYADYARSASETVNRYATTLQNKDPDELVDDARDVIRKSPGAALAGAAIIGFGLIRVLKAGLPEDGDGRTKGRKS